MNNNACVRLKCAFEMCGDADEEVVVAVTEWTGCLALAALHHCLSGVEASPAGIGVEVLVLPLPAPIVPQEGVMGQGRDRP